MTRLVLRERSLIAVIGSLEQDSKTFQSSYDSSFHEAHVINICEDLVSCGFLQAVVEATYRQYVSVARLMHRSPEALQLVKKVHDEAAASDGTAGKEGLGITHLGKVLLRG